MDGGSSGPAGSLGLPAGASSIKSATSSSAGASFGSLAGLGFTMAGDYVKSRGAAAGDEYMAARLDRAAEYGRLAAVQTGAQLTEKLNMTLGNIDSIRAASHDDPTSPTGVAFRDRQEYLGTREKVTAVANLNAQAAQQNADAAYYRKMSSNALLSGDISMGADFFKAFASPLKVG